MADDCSKQDWVRESSPDNMELVADRDLKVPSSCSMHYRELPFVEPRDLLN